MTHPAQTMKNPRKEVKPVGEIVQPNTIPKAYAALGAQMGFAPLPPSKLRLYLGGLEGDGKSTFVSSIPNSIILDFETGDYAVKYPRSPHLPIETSDESRRVFEQLLRDGGAGRKPPFEHVVIDTGDRWLHLVSQDLCKEAGKENIGDVRSEGGGYSLLAGRILKTLDDLWQAGYSWVVVGHMKEQDITVGGKKLTVIRDTMFRSSVDPIRRVADYIGIVHTVRKEEKTTKTIDGKSYQVSTGNWTMDYRMSLIGSTTRRAKQRVTLSVPEITLPEKDGWSAFVAAYEAACLKYKEEIGNA